jgi:long-chain acyl-CoA synthetase
MAKQYPTLPQRLLEALDRHPSPRAQMYRVRAALAARGKQQAVGSRWESTAAPEMLRRIAGLSAALAEIDVDSGERVAIFAPNCPEWHIADFAVLGLGAVVVPIYFRESPERIEHIVGHSGAKAIFVAGEEQCSRLAQVRPRLPNIAHVVAAGDVAAVGTAAGDVLSYEKLIASAGQAQVAAYRSRVATLHSDQLASIIYTSGTTGEPKGVMLSHANFVSNEMGSFEGLTYGPEDAALSFLPLSHVYERVTDYGFLFRGIALAYVPRMEDVVQALVEVRPTLGAAVPRFFEKLYANIMEAGAKATGLRRRLFDWSVDVARRAVPWKAYGRPVPASVKAQWWLADKLVYGKFRAGIGGRMRLFISGGGPLAPELAEFFNTVGVPVSQGYGLTETSPVISFSVKAPDHIGTSGHLIRDVEVRIADDGEILVRGPCVMMGYYKDPEATRAAISPDGWFATGDIGYLDKDGYLTITDRKRDVLKTAGGKMIAPAPIENVLKTSPYIQSVALVGDKRRFIAALIVPDFGNLQVLAREKELVGGSSPAQLCAQPWVRDLIEKEIARLTANLAQYETIKRFALLERDFTFDGGELTYTLKVRRREIEKRYAEVIEQLYAEPSPAHT